MSDVAVFIDGERHLVQAGTSVAAAVLNAGKTRVRTSVAGQPRTPLCGMGICYECRVSIDGMPHARSCQIFCQPGMRIATG